MQVAINMYKVTRQRIGWEESVVKRISIALMIMFVFLLMISGCVDDSGDGDDGGDGDGGAVAGSSSAELLVHNDSSSTIVRLFFSPSSSSDFGPDRLGSSVIRPGDTFRFVNISPCDVNYDVRAELSNGARVERFGLRFSCSPIINDLTIREL